MKARGRRKMARWKKGERKNQGIKDGRQEGKRAQGKEDEEEQQSDRGRRGEMRGRRRGWDKGKEGRDALTFEIGGLLLYWTLSPARVGAVGSLELSSISVGSELYIQPVTRSNPSLSCNLRVAVPLLSPLQGQYCTDFQCCRPGFELPFQSPS